MRFDLAIDEFGLCAPGFAALRNPKTLDPNSGGELVFAPILWDRRALTGLGPTANGVPTFLLELDFHQGRIIAVGAQDRRVS